MATLQKIRNNAGLLVSIIIGLALLSFILGDLFSSGNPMQSSQTEVAEIAGQAVSIQLYQSRIDENIENFKRNTGQSSLDQATMDQLQEQTWEQLVREYLMQGTFEDLGIGVSGQELFDMVQGNQIAPEVMQIPIFQNQQTGQFDRNLVIQFLKNMELDPSGQAQSSWTAFEKALAQEKINQKYNTLIEKGLYVTSIEAKNEATNKALSADFDYITLRYNAVADSMVQFNESDLQAYYKENIDKYKQEELREINYLTFPVVASEEDDNETRLYIENAKDEFAAVENNEQYISLNSDLPFDAGYYAENELPEAIASLFNSERGTLMGPYKENNTYKISKVVDFKQIPDSVKARHILIRPAAGVDAVAKADSILNAIKKGSSFATLAQEFSQDGSAANGGDLGWFPAGAMVQPFNDACFFGKKGDLVTVQTQFGSHVIEIMDQSKKTQKVQIATLARVIEPSSKTYQATYAKASKFGSANRSLTAFLDAAKAEGLNVRVASVKPNDKQVANLENSRSLIRWAYESEKGEVSEILEYNDVFVVAALKTVQEEGTASLDDVRMDVEREVRKEKKAEFLMAKMNEAAKNANTLQAVAEKLETEVREASNASFGAYSIPGLGFEPQLQAYAITLPTDKVSEAIKGNTGVYVVQVKNQRSATDELNVTAEQMQLTRSYRSRVVFQLYEAIKDAAEIEDNRSRFY
ncbi:MAG: SurA N-terminal domain-containing protein [Salinivirgaceae bacterium]